ncbi:MAG: hypothetical protein GQ574_01785 [Crocinitomix sp.]|nr:hypothetical protein [Crocinitomix sp.]
MKQLLLFISLVCLLFSCSESYDGTYTQEDGPNKHISLNGDVITMWEDDHYPKFKGKFRVDNSNTIILEELHKEKSDGSTGSAEEDKKFINESTFKLKDNKIMAPLRSGGWLAYIKE